MTHRTTTTLLLGCLLIGILLTAPGAEGRAKLRDAQWNPEPGFPPGSELSEDRRTLTTEIPEPPTDLIAHATLTFDISRGNDGILSFLSDHSWVKCEAPDGLIVGESGTVAVVCKAEGDKLKRVKKKTRVYLKADPPGGGYHKKFYWILLPQKD